MNDIMWKAIRPSEIRKEAPVRVPVDSRLGHPRTLCVAGVEGLSMAYRVGTNAERVGVSGAWSTARLNALLM